MFAATWGYYQQLNICEIAIWGVKPGTGDQLRGAGLADTVIVGADRKGNYALHGSVAMLQIYTDALYASAVHCVYDSGHQLITSGHLSKPHARSCLGSVVTGCTSMTARNRAVAAHQHCTTEKHTRKSTVAAP